ncbi:MAG: hypothetical protein HYX69_07495 [Planctomycetia bacterium]|nr:hypothetical protein [Planctomycetia bacterium]
MSDEACNDVERTTHGRPLIDADAGCADDAALAEVWAAFAQLLAAAEPPVDKQRLVARIAERVEQRARRRRTRASTFALAAAAMLLVAVGIASWRTRATPPEAIALADPPGEAVVAPAPGQAAPWIAWEDDVDQQAALLAIEACTAEYRWQHGPDSEALLQARADELQQEMAASPL